MSATRLGEWLGSARLIAHPPDSSAVPMAPRVSTSRWQRCWSAWPTA